MSPPDPPPLRSIRWRWTLWISALLIAVGAVSFLIIDRSTVGHLRAQIDESVQSDDVQLAQSLRLIGEPNTPMILSRVRHYVGATPFASIPTLLFVVVDGQRVVSNYPELTDRHAAVDDGESDAAQSEENRLDRAMRSVRVGASVRDLADIGDVRIQARRLMLAGRRLMVGAGEPLASVEQAERSILRSFLLAGVFIVLFVVVGSYLIGTGITAPLRRMARVAATIDAGDLRPRVQPGRHDEIGVLANAFNHMVDRLDRAFRRQREFVADASHELRTPITVIQGQLEVLADCPDPSQDDVRRVERIVRRETHRMRRMVDDLLLLAQAERFDFLALSSIQVRSFLTQLIDDAATIADRRFELGPIPSGQLTADPDRLAQALRNLLGNAVTHTAEHHGRVRLEAESLPHGELRITISDDGPGIPEDQLERIFDRFHRIRSRAAPPHGAGLGLSIVRAIVDAHGGRVGVGRADGTGGARFDLILPGFLALPEVSAAPTATSPRS